MLCILRFQFPQLTNDQNKTSIKIFCPLKFTNKDHDLFIYARITGNQINIQIKLIKNRQHKSSFIYTTLRLFDYLVFTFTIKTKSGSLFQ